MYEQQQHFVDLQSDSGFGDESSWLAGDDDLGLSPHRSNAGANSGNENLDRRLLKDLVEMVPLIEHYMEHKERSSFKQRGSMIYTKMPSRESLSRRGRNGSQTVPGRKKRDTEGDNDATNKTREEDENVKALDGAADKEVLTRLREQVNDLQTKLLEKDEVLKSMETSKNQVKDIQEKLEETKRLVAEKEMLLKSMQLQLSDTKIKLADKQAALEKTQWESKTTGTKAIKLQEQLDAVEEEISTFSQVFETLGKTESKKLDRDYDATPYEFDHLPYLDDVDETDLRKLEEARLAYIAAVNTAKEREDEESLAMAAQARAYLQSLVNY